MHLETVFWYAIFYIVYSTKVKLKQLWLGYQLIQLLIFARSQYLLLGYYFVLGYFTF